MGNVPCFFRIKNAFPKFRLYFDKDKETEWLNDMATKENVNFSSVLQEALVKKLHIG